MSFIQDYPEFCKESGHLSDVKDKFLNVNYRACNKQILPFNSRILFDNPRHAQVAELALYDAYIESQGPDRWISYSRNRNHYSRNFYDRKLYTYLNVVSAIDVLVREGWLNGWVAGNSGPSGKQSTFKASDQLLCLMQTPPVLGIDPVKVLHMKDADKKLIPYKNTAETEKMERGIHELNEALAGTNIEIEDFPELEKRGPYLIISNGKGGQQYINTTHDRFYRSFNNGTTKNGGRGYGHHVQQISFKGDRLHRDHVLFNGNRTREYDYSCLHIRLLYACAGKILRSDAYDIEGWERGVVKVAVNIMFNASGKQQAILAMVYYGVVPDRQTAQRLMGAINRKHHHIRMFFHSRVGLTLMRIDSDLIMSVARAMLRKGVCILPIHDSARVEEQHFNDLQETMEDFLEIELTRLAKYPNEIRVA